MIPIDTWVTQIVGYGDLILNDAALRNAWIDGDRTTTSVTNFDELYEQIFDDLDSSAMEQEFERTGKASEGQLQSVKAFLQQILVVSKQIKMNPSLSDSAALLASGHWQGVVKAARVLRSSFGSPLVE